MSGDRIDIAQLKGGSGDFSYTGLNDWQKAVFASVDPTPGDGVITQSERSVAADLLFNAYGVTAESYDPETQQTFVTNK